MTSKKKRYEEQLLEAIAKHNITFFSHCFAYVPFTATTAYNNKLDKLDTIKSAIEKNRVQAKNKMIAKWLESDNATLQIAAFRLMSDSDEHRKLNQSYTDHTSGGESITPPIKWRDKKE